MNWKITSSILGSVALLITIVAAGIAFDNTYAREVAVVETLQQFQQEQKTSQTLYQLKSDYRFYEYMHGNLTTEMYKYKRLLRESPNDTDLKLEYDDIVKQRNYVKQKMDSILETIK